MNVLDENILLSQRDQLRARKVHCQLVTGFLVGFCLSIFAFYPLSFDFPREKS
jgi:hypothetical protein